MRPKKPATTGEGNLFRARLDQTINLKHELVQSTGLANQDSHFRRLMSAQGIGPIISSAMVAAIGTGDAFDKSRGFAAWLGRERK